MIRSRQPRICPDLSEYSGLFRILMKPCLAYVHDGSSAVNSSPGVEFQAVKEMVASSFCQCVTIVAGSMIGGHPNQENITFLGFRHLPGLPVGKLASFRKATPVVLLVESTQGLACRVPESAL